MEINEDGFLEELLALRRETWETNPSTEINGFFSTNTWEFDGLDSTSSIILHNNNSTISSYESFSSSIDHQPTSLDCSSFTHHEFYLNNSTCGPLITDEPISFPGPSPAQAQAQAQAQAHYQEADQYSIMSSIMEEDNEGDGGVLDHVQGTCKAEPGGGEIPTSSFNIGLCMERNTTPKSKIKKIEGQPSKNLMAERRRRKRLNDRLSMLRSVVPKISKMDRTSILGDTIDYMKELLERIHNLQEQINVGSSDQLNVMSIFKDVKPSDVLVRNSPKFDVERRNLDTKVEICCAGKPGLLLSTVTTLEALGLEIQQCVISCFNDFSLQASCSEEIEQRSIIGSEDIKQALFRNAGYGGRCL